MKFTINYEHIFFDRYAVDNKKEAESIVAKVFHEAAIVYSERDGVYDCTESERLGEICDILKREFYIKLEKFEDTCPTCEQKREDDLIEYITENYCNEMLTVEDVCEKTALSRRDADTLLKKTIGMTVSEFIRHLRCKKAAEHLKEGKKVEECAMICGFGSIKTMQRAFKTVFGKTPAEYRSLP